MVNTIIVVGLGSSIPRVVYPDYGSGWPGRSLPTLRSLSYCGLLASQSVLYFSLLTLRSYCLPGLIKLWSCRHCYKNLADSLLFFWFQFTRNGYINDVAAVSSGLLLSPIFRVAALCIKCGHLLTAAGLPPYTVLS